MWLERISGSGPNFCGLVGCTPSFQLNNFLPGERVPGHRQNFGPLVSENGGSSRVFPVDFRRPDVSRRASAQDHGPPRH